MLNSMLEDLLNLEGDIDQLFTPAVLPIRVVSTNSTPAMNIVDEGKQFVATFDVPGVKKEDVKITKKGSVLTISGERKKGTLPDNGKWLRSESWAGSFTRTLELPELINAEGISAELTNGVLRVSIPKAEEAKSREIAVR